MNADTAEAPLCPGCLEVQDLIARAEAMETEDGSDPQRVIRTLPALLEGALACVVLAASDAAHARGKLGEAVRLLGVAAAQAEALRVRAAELGRHGS
jgi:hypothetical protein